MNENIFVMLYTRIKALLAKLISVKGLFAVILTLAYFKNPSLDTLVGVYASWGLFIGAREFEKIKGIIPRLGG